MSRQKKCQGCGEPLESTTGIRPCSKLCMSCCANKPKQRKALPRSGKPIAKRKPLPRNTKPLKRSTKRLKRTRLKTTNSFDTARFRRYIDFKVSFDIARGVPIACVETGKLIPHHDTSLISGMCVSHVLDGASNKKYYWLPDASVWMTPDAHRQWHEGDRKSMRCYDLMMKRREWLLALPQDYINEREVK
jgi:hypothetical protein